MTRALRIDVPFALYHVTSRGNEQRSIYRDDGDRHRFLESLGEAVERFRWSLTTWVLMDNHYHLVVQTPEANLSRGMHWLNGAYVGWFNRRHERAGHLLQGRFKAFLIEKETYFMEVLRYVVLNPVRANMVAHPQEYAWSSYRQTVGLDSPQPWLDLRTVYSLFDPDPIAAKWMYRDFVMTRVNGQERLWDQVINRMYLGSGPWAGRMRELVESWPRSTDFPAAERAIGRPTMRAIVAAAAEACGEAEELIWVRGGCRSRSLVAWVARNEGLISLRSIAAALRLRSEGHVLNLVRRCEREFTADARRLPELDRALTALGCTSKRKNEGVTPGAKERTKV